MKCLKLIAVMAVATGLLLLAGCDDDDETQAIDLVSLDDNDLDFQSDLAEKGESAGDQFGFIDELQRDGESAGTVAGLCTSAGTQQEPKGLCGFTLELDEGQITSQGVFDFRAEGPQEVAIVGGTGDYEAASGTVSVDVSGGGKETPITVNLIE